MKRLVNISLLLAMIFMSLLVVTVVASQTHQTRTITIWLSWVEEAQKKWLLNSYIPAFEAKTGIKVNTVEMPGDEQTLRAKLLAGKGPDIVGLAGPSYVPFYIEAGFLKPLDEYAEKYHWKDLLVDLYWQLGKYKGKFYTIPGEFEAMVLFYNPRVFRENGWTPPKTIKEMEELAAKMKEKGIIPFANGNADWAPAIEWIFTAAVNAIAGPEKVYKALTGKIPWTDSDFVEAVEATKRWFKNGWLGEGKFFSLNCEPFELLVEGKAGMSIMGTWGFGDIPYYSKSPGDWDWVPFPSKEGLPYPILAMGVGNSAGININAKDPDAAAQYLDFGLREPFNLELFAQDLIVNGSAAYTPIKGFTWSDEVMAKLVKLGVDERVLRFLKLGTEAFENNTYGYVTWTFWPPKSDRYIIDNLGKVWLDKMSSEEFLKKLQDVFDKELKAGSVIYIPPRS